jgi:hypothetical protein
VTGFTAMTDGMGTRIPKYAEQHDVDSLRQLVEYLDKRLIECERLLMAIEKAKETEFWGKK